MRCILETREGELLTSLPFIPPSCMIHAPFSLSHGLCTKYSNLSIPDWTAICLRISIAIPIITHMVEIIVRLQEGFGFVSQGDINYFVTAVQRRIL